jgi:hypothetical protein
MGRYDVVGKTKAKFLEEIEAFKSKEVTKLILSSDFAEEEKKAEDKEKNDEELKNNPIYETIQKIFQELIITVIGERNAMKMNPSENPERTAEVLGKDFIDDFQGIVEAKDREDNLTEVGNDIKSILELTVKDLRKTLELKDEIVKKTKK